MAWQEEQYKTWQEEQYKPIQDNITEDETQQYTTRQGNQMQAETIQPYI